MNSNVQNRVKKISLKVLVLSLLFLLSLGAFAIIAHEAVYEHEDAFDESVSAFISNHSNPALIDTMRAITFFGSSGFLIPAYVLLVGYFLFKRKYPYVVNISIIALSSFGLMVGLKSIFHRQRPQLPVIKGITSYSFPSGHSLSSFIFCSILGYLIWNSTIRPVWRWVLIFLLSLFTLMIGLSRIVLNVHFATDVIGGLCMGVTWVILSFWVLKKFSRKEFKTNH
ncbi:phosphatase PAP2 family protein [Flavitalea flava]